MGQSTATTPPLPALEALSPICDHYPLSAPTASIAIHDVGSLHSILKDDNNFSIQTSCEVFDIDRDGRGRCTQVSTDAELDLLAESSVTAGPGCQRVWFFGLEACPDNKFKSQVSLGRSRCQRFFNSVKLSPQFATFFLGQYGVHHMPSSGFQTFNETGEVARLDFICQQPRWGAQESRQKLFPVSAYTSFDDCTGSTTCLVTSSPGDPRVEGVKARLRAAFPASKCLPSGTTNAKDPFLISCLLSHETFMQSDQRIVDIAADLYTTLDHVDSFAKGAYDREILRSLTFKLHRISQDADFLVSSAEIGIVMLDSMLAAQQELASLSAAKRSNCMVTSSNTSGYLKKAYESRKRWLLGAKSRKDTTMSLVYHLVAQQDTEINMSIARDAKNDSSSMKVIAIVSMVFLPASAISSFFGMGFFSTSDSGFRIAPEWWYFVAATIPVTLLVLLTWWMWNTFHCRSGPKLLEPIETSNLPRRLLHGLQRWTSKRRVIREKEIEAESV